MSKPKGETINVNAWTKGENHGAINIGGKMAATEIP